MRSPFTDPEPQAPLRPRDDFQPDPYSDYGRFLTPEGGILLVYKDLDEDWRHGLWSVAAGLGFSGLEAWYAWEHALDVPLAFKIACWIIAAILNNLIVSKPVEIYRQVEIRPDCMIIGGEAVFWQRFMEGGRPYFRSGLDGNVLCGIYGTRVLEYLTVRRFDEFDRAPEIFAMHLNQAIEQLWNVPEF